MADSLVDAGGQDVLQGWRFGIGRCGMTSYDVPLCRRSSIITVQCVHCFYFAIGSLIVFVDTLCWT